MSFNPRSREGSDCVVEYLLEIQDSFNPRSREGSDKFFFVSIHVPARVSIHAPARGATRG